MVSPTAREKRVTWLAAVIVCGCSLAQPATAEETELATDAFLQRLVSPNRDDKNIAETYLFRISGETSGTIWCDASKIKTVTVREFVFEYLKKQPTSRMQEPASSLIKEALATSFPCKAMK